MRAVLFCLLSHRSDQRPPTSPPLARLDREALEAQRSYPGSRACTSRTSQSRYHHLLLLYLGEGWKDLPKLLVSHFCLWRPVHRSGGEWMTFHPAWGQWLFRLGRRWTAVHPGSGWIPVCSHWGPVGSCPAASQRLPWTESQFGPASVEGVYHKDGHQES